MKKLVDGKVVSARSYYFLLDWNERDEWHFIVEKFNKNTLKELNITEYMILWLHATTTDYNRMVSESNNYTNEDDY